MERSSERRSPAWVDTFVSTTPPDYTGFPLILAIVVILLLVGARFEQHRYELIVDSPNPEVVRSSWWGLRTERFPIRWMTFHSAGGPYEAWCVQDKRGEWYPYILEDP